MTRHPRPRPGALFGWLLLTIVLSGDASAQRRPRTGFWVEVGVGPGQVRLACSGCPDVTRARADASFISIGGAVSDHVLLGIESFALLGGRLGLAESDSAVIARSSALSVVVLWYPWRRGFFLKGGMGGGGAAFTITTAAGQPVPAEGIGTGMTFGAGFDVPISRHFALSAAGGAWITAIGDVVLPTTTVDDAIATLYSFTISAVLR